MNFQILLIISCIAFSSYAQHTVRTHTTAHEKALALVQSQSYRSFPQWLLDTEQLDPARMENIISHCPEGVIQFIESMNTHFLSNKLSSRKMLLVGRPGTGKSSIAKTIAAKCGLPFFLYNAGYLKNEYQNSGHRNIKMLLAHALNHGRPCVVIIEKLEFLFNETTPDYHSNISMLKQIQDTVKEYPVVFICTYNKGIHDFPEEIVGRFRSSVINVPLPNYEQRVQLIEYFLKNNSKRPSKDFSAKTIASKTEGFSPRRLHNLLEEAAYFYSENNEITTQDYLRALQENQIQEPWYLRLRKSLPWLSIISLAATSLNLYYGYKYYKALQRYQ